MSRIVVLSSVYLGTPSANGICARNLVTALRAEGYDVDVVCYENQSPREGEEKESGYTIPQPMVKQSHGFVEKFFHVVATVFGSLKTILNTETVSFYLKRLREIHQNNPIDAIVAMFFPFESVEAMCRFKAENNQVKTIIYELDSVGDGVSNSSTLFLLGKKYKKWLREKYRTASGTVVMRSHEEYWRRLFGGEFSEKLYVTDLPVLKDKTAEAKSDNSQIKMLYSGAIEKRYRSPSYLLSVLGDLERKMPFEMYFYSKGDCEEEIAEASKRVHTIKQFGYVSPEKLENATLKTDVLINLGNTFSNSVPSKLISYLGYGKPIIHFSSQKDDVCINYLKDYPLALIVDQSKPKEYSADEIVEFINSAKGTTVSGVVLNEAFYMNFPRYSAQIVDKIIKQQNAGAAKQQTLGVKG